MPEIDDQPDLRAWFDLSRPIPKDDLERAIQTMRDAVTAQGGNPYNEIIAEEIRLLRRAARHHNLSFVQAPPTKSLVPSIRPAVKPPRPRIMGLK
jgi:hypothetical protein